MHNSKTNIHLISEYFVSEILKQKIQNFSLEDLVRNNHGKPELPQSRLSFNLSHCSGNLALLVCDQKSCGIDIQAVKEKEAYSDALKSVLTDREYMILEKMGIDDHFFRLWSLKEAYIKAIGSSIWYGRDYDFSCLLDGYSDKWQFSNGLYLYSTEIYKGFFLSIAVPHIPDVIDYKKL